MELQQQKSTRILFAVNDLCPSISLIHYTTSTHPGGNHNGRLNEENTGTALMCYFDKSRSFYGKVGDLRNSQRGNTPHYGIGLVGTVFDFRIRNHEFGFRLGAEALRIKYEIPKYNAAIERSYTLPYGGVAYNYRDQFFFGANQYFLPEGVKLRSFELSWKLKMNFF